MDLVSSEDLESLLQQFCGTSYRTTEQSSLAVAIQEKCEVLFSKDYKYQILDNSSGELAATYPSKIILLEGEKINDVLDVHDRFHKNYDLPNVRSLITKARGGRFRTRFPVPVILYEGKNVCRSATVFSLKEVYANKVMDYIGSTFQGVCEQLNLNDEGQSYNDGQPGCSAEERLCDTRLLEAFSVSHICDLMLRNVKMKNGVLVFSSSEKIEESAYSAFNILSLPYPGCNFFKNYHCHEHSHKDLMFDWNQDYVDLVLNLPSDTLVYFSNLGLEFSEYKTWDLITLTQNYFKVLLRYIIEGTSGLLIHCVSGWDRTPLFISLLRLSLWADGKIHASLSAIEILYLTLAYDWYLFGHKLPERLRSEEEILYFCFHFIKHLSGDEFSIVKRNVTVGKEHFASKHENSATDTNCNTSHSSGQPYRQENYSSVPVPVPSVRQRADSISSIGCGRPQVNTGSNDPLLLTREDKLERVRSLFHKVYVAVLG